MCVKEEGSNVSDIEEDGVHFEVWGIKSNKVERQKVHSGYPLEKGDLRGGFVVEEEYTVRVTYWENGVK